MVTIKFEFVPDTTVSETEGGMSVRGQRFNQTLQGLGPGCIDAARRMTEGPVSEEALASAVVSTDGLNGLMLLERMKYQLHTLGALCRTAWASDGRLATLRPVTSGPAFVSRAVKPDARYRLSRFAFLRRGEEGAEVHCPLGTARLVCHDDRAAALIGALCRWSSLAGVAEQSGLSTAAAAELLDMLLFARALVEQGEGPAIEDDLQQPLGGWEFHDLLFHIRTRLGRHDGPYGGTFHMKGRAAPPPVAEPRRWTHDIALARPADTNAAGQGADFADVIERRRSIRDYGETPIGAAALGEFLYRTARVQQVLNLPDGEMGLSLRPYPGGGAIHELEIYPIVARCEGLDPGLYHYDPIDHRLGRVAGKDGRVTELLRIAWNTADRKSDLQVFFTITARFRRLQWKYQSVAYAVILKNVGVLYEAMYLTATAMGLAPCSLGGGTIDLFCAAAGLDPYAESPVGEFVLGSRP